MPNYNSIYTGLQVDEYLGKAAVSVPETRTVNGKALSTDILLTAADIGAAPALQSNVTLYVSPSGNDSTGDGTQNKPYQTIQKAISILPKDLNGFSPQIHVAAGAYNGFTIANMQGMGLYFYFYGGVVINGKIAVINACCYFQAGEDGSTLTVNAPENASGSVVEVMDCAYVNSTIQTTVDGRGQNVRGFLVYRNSCLSFDRNVIVEINNAGFAALMTGGGGEICGYYSLSGTGNAVGLFANGGVIRYHVSSLTSTTDYSSALGGRIYGGAQTNAPSY